jgi:hypothetical protein
MERALTVGFPYLDAQKVVLALMAAKVESLSLALQTGVIRALMALTVFRDKMALRLEQILVQAVLGERLLVARVAKVAVAV